MDRVDLENILRMEYNNRFSLIMVSEMQKHSKVKKNIGIIGIFSKI